MKTQQKKHGIIGKFAILVTVLLFIAAFLGIGLTYKLTVNAVNLSYKNVFNGYGDPNMSEKDLFDATNTYTYKAGGFYV